MNLPIIGRLIVGVGVGHYCSKSTNKGFLLLKNSVWRGGGVGRAKKFRGNLFAYFIFLMSFLTKTNFLKMFVPPPEFFYLGKVGHFVSFIR